MRTLTIVMTVTVLTAAPLFEGVDLDDFDQFVAGFFVPQLTNRLHSLPSLTAVTAPSATRTRNRVPAGASPVERNTSAAGIV